MYASCSSLHQRAEQSRAKQLYYQASELYQSLYTKTPPQKHKLRSYYALRAAECNHKLRYHSKAYRQYKQAERYKSEDSLLYYRLGYTAMTLGEYTEAETYFTKQLQITPNHQATQIGLASSVKVKQDNLRVSNYQIQALKNLWSVCSDYSPMISPIDNSLYFTSRRQKRNTNVSFFDYLGNSNIGRQFGKTSKQGKSPETGESLATLYRVERNSLGQWQTKPNSLKEMTVELINSEGASLSSDGDFLFYAQGKGVSRRIYRSRRLSTGAWEKGEELKLWQDKDHWATQPSISANGRQLYFVSERSGGKDKDIYVVSLLSGEPIGSPQRLGTDINSLGDELNPYAVGDSTLYFASDGRIGYGGYDLYKAELQANGLWDVQHLPKPLNSSSDDWAIAPMTSIPLHTDKEEFVECGVIASSREDTRGRPHLYFYSLPRVRSTLEGYVRDREGTALVGASVQMVARYGTTVGERWQTTKADGSFHFEIEPNNSYVLLASYKGFLNQYAELNTVAEDQGISYEMDFRLVKKQSPEVLRELYYETNSAEIRPESASVLSELVHLLDENPHIKLNIIAHSDRQGNEQYNLNLSRRRALAVVEALKARGISSERITHLGKGQSEPYIVSEAIAKQYPFLSLGDKLSPTFIQCLMPSEQAVCDALNRRTEFIVLSEE